MIVSESFIKTWFTLQRQLIAGLQVAYVDLHGTAVGPKGLIVGYPDGMERQSELALAAQLAQRSGAPVTGSGNPGADGAETLRIACPLHLGKHTGGAVVVEVCAAPDQQAEVLQMLRWGEAWLNLAVAQRDEAPSADSLGVVVAAGLQVSTYEDTVTAVLALLPAQAGCERVALGRASGSGVALEAVSAVVDLNRRSTRARAMERAMAASLRSQQTLYWRRQHDAAAGLPALHELAELGELEAIVIVPVQTGSQPPLVFCFEFATGAQAPVNPVTASEACAQVAAPLIELRRERERAWWTRFFALTREGLAGLFGKDGRVRTGLTAVAALMALVLAVSPATYRVSAPAALEGAVQRAVVAPFDGFVSEAVLRAGQQVATGDLLARLDDRDLKSEQQRLLAEQAELARQHRQALATLDHAEANVLDAQLDQARAGLALIDSQLKRTVLRAPFDGVIINGDWSRSEGVPVSRGDLLFEIAPLQHYRVALQVSDREVAALDVGQQGELILSAMPQRPFRLKLANIATLAREGSGEPTFRVEASLDEPGPALRPGMQGVAKVSVGERPRWWVWTHAFTDWIRLRIWQWSP